MNVREFYAYMCGKIPAELTLTGDRDGMSCCPDPGREVNRVMIALDVTDSVIDEAAEDGCEVILSHHPMLYGGIDSVCADEYSGNRIIKLVRSGISVMSFHTRLDAAEGGVNDLLADSLGLEVISRFAENGICRLGVLDAPVSAPLFADRIRQALGAPFVEYSDGGRLITKVAVCGGSAGSMIGEAIAAGADALVGGEIGYHRLTDGPGNGISLFAAGHFYTENRVCHRLFELTAEAGLIPVITFSNRISVSTEGAGCGYGV